MVTKIKPRRMNTSGPGSLGKDLAYQTEVVFDWAEGGSGVGDMRYSDFNFQDLTDSTVVLDLRTEVTPTGNFVVTAPTTIKDGQYYILRVNNGATVYTMALTGGITNPHGVSLTLTPNSTDQFEFLAVGTALELQPADSDLSGVVMLTGDQTIAGTKTFSTSPVVPNKTTDATNTGTVIATEAQVYKKADAVDLNTKTFYLSSASDLINAQAAWDWYSVGKNPIIVFNGENYFYYDYYLDSGEYFLSFTTPFLVAESSNAGSDSNTYNKYLEIKTINGSVVQCTYGAAGPLTKYLRTDTDYGTPYTPLYAGSPATKKYVDDGDTKIASAAPSNPTEGMLWYDTINDVLKSYDGANWNNVNTQVTVEDNLTSTSTTNALSANQGRILDGKIADLMALGKFLSLWNAATGQPISFPYITPYAYSTGDYFLVEVVDITTNYRPDGSSYTGTASSTVETDELEQGDVYIYDGSVWLLQSNHGKTVSFANIAGDPYDNTNLATALGDKQDVLTAGANITIDPVTNEISASNTTYSSATTTTAGIVKLGSDTAIAEAIQSPAGATNKTYPVQLNASGQMGVNVPRANTTYGAGTGINIDANNDIQNTGVLSVNGSTGVVTVSESNTKTFTLSSFSDLTTAQAAYDWYIAGNNPILIYNDGAWLVDRLLGGDLYFFGMVSLTDYNNNGYSNLTLGRILFNTFNSVVSGISRGNLNLGSYIRCGVNYTTPYTPQYDGSPATKKYVDDNAGIQNDTTGTTTTVTKIRAGTEAEYNALGTHSANIIYHIY